MRSLIATIGLAVTAAHAGAPYVTDDPGLPGTGRWEIYHFVGGAHSRGTTEGAAGLEVNYAYSDDLQLTLVVPVAFEQSDRWHAGRGVIETAAKFRLLRAKPNGAIADVAVVPRIFWPTGSERYATDDISVQLPIWAGRDIGAWSVFGGGGYQFNPGRDARDFWVAGIGVSRVVAPRLSIGAEIYHKTPDAIDSKTFTGVNLGASFSLNEHWSLLASAGPAIKNDGEVAQYAFFVALKFDR